MSRHVVCGRYGSADTATVAVRAGETDTELGLLSEQNKLEYGIGTALDDLAKMGVFPSSTAIDLLVLAAHVHAADTRIARNTESQDSWTREIRLVVPVSDAATWNKAKAVIRRALNFLTGDLWEVEFRPLPDDLPNIKPTGTLPLEGVPFDGVSLFSGGLDSLIGAIDMLQNGKSPLLVSHAGDGTTSNAQAECYQKLKQEYSANKFDRMRLWMDLADVKVEGSDHEMTTRGRSFLFFAAGIFAGSGLDKPFTLTVPENGLIALNVPLDPLRLGSHSTRTTHPFYIARWNELLQIVSIPGTIVNPYWDKTKGEMTEDCANKKLLESIVPHSISCAHPSSGRWQGLPAQHCGHCLPCLIRRAALEKGLGNDIDKTTYKISDLAARVLDSTQAEGMQVRSFQYAIDRLSTRPQLAAILIHINGSLSDETPEQQTALAGVYSRGLDEVGQILKGIQTQAK
jgi:7-cyano-7-deazaguanine synthase in queuosine biosynthesis